MTSLTFFGTSAASPSYERGFSCIGIIDRDDVLLLDCGDGAIRNILRFGVDVRSISGILITHYHSDHLSGLTQVIETMSIKNKKTDLNIFGPPGLKEYFSTIQKITNVASHKEFKINLKELSPNQQFETQNQRVSTFEMDHTIPCLGYRIETNNRIVSFTGDTQPCNSLKELGKNADIFIHEATFLQKDLEKAGPPKHSTPKQAASAASITQSKKLVLTHVNDDLEKPEEMLTEASEVFSNVVIAYDGLRLGI